MTSIIRFIGDVHGKYGRYSTILDNSPHRTHQVGDMGVGFRKWPHGEWERNPPHAKMAAGGHTWHRGNHDNPDESKKHSQYIQDGTVIDNMMFVGGAVSIDKALRIEDFSWWPDEELNHEELQGVVQRFERKKPEIMITHECPEEIAQMIVAGLNGPRNGPTKLDPRFASRTRVAFDKALLFHRPKLWLFGHWHVPFDQIIDGTRFICLPELAQLDVDTEKAEPIGEVIMQRERW